MDLHFPGTALTRPWTHNDMDLHGPGTALTWNPAKICLRVVQQILRMDRWSLVQPLQQAMSTQALTSEIETSVEGDEALLSISSAS